MVTLARAVGLIRRRGFPVHALAVGPTNAPGISRLTIMMQSDEATAERAVQHLQKIVGVHAAMALPPEGMVARELALVKLRAPVERYAELLDVVQLYHGAVVDESADVLIVELSGPEAFVLSGIRALERFGVIEVAGSGTVALESGAAEPRADTQPQLEAGAT
jgi:acetolactate synthase-1/3 small subunit